MIVQFVNRKFAMKGLYKGKNLKGTKLYGNTPVYINKFLQRIQVLRVYNTPVKKSFADRLMQDQDIKTLGNVDFVEVSHITDFGKYNLDISSFLK